MRQAVRRSQARNVSFPAPVRGLMEFTPVTQPDPLGAEVCENWLPTRRGLQVRGGITRAAFVTDPVVSLMSYVEAASPALFAATADAIYNITSLSPTVAPPPSASQLNSGDWSVQQIGVSGGNYLVAANGADPVHLYNGGAWNPVAAVAINDLQYDALVTSFTVGETVTGGTSGASATILGIIETTATTGTLKLGTITGGPFQDNELLTSAGGEADANGAESAASAITITGVSTSALSHVWLYRSRLFFVEKDSLKAWYLPVSAVGGAAGDINLAGVFRRGGSLLFGATWSIDTGDGLDDKCIFVSDEGEVAIYSGTDPSDPMEWALEGRYDIGQPLGKRATMSAGGDLLIATVDGIVPLSEVMRKDPAALSLAAVTRNIERSWAAQVGEVSEDVELVKWSSGNLLLCMFPGATRLYTANLQTGAWGLQTGWFGNCAVEHLGNAYIGRNDGRVYRLNNSGTDDGAAFTARVCFAFSDLGDPTTYKQPTMARASFFAAGSFGWSVSASSDYRPTFPAAPSAGTASSTDMIWDVSNWNEAVWGGGSGDPPVGLVSQWRGVSAPGHAVAPVLQVTSGGTERLDVELLSVDMLVEAGGRAA